MNFKDFVLSSYFGEKYLNKKNNFEAQFLLIGLLQYYKYFAGAKYMRQQICGECPVAKRYC